MAETIDELLVKLGLETDAKGFKEANNQFSNLRSTALTVGAAIGTAFVGAGVAAAKMSFDVAKSADDLAKWSRTAGVTAQYAHKLGFAMKQVGGSEADARTLIELANSLRDSSQWGELPARAFTAAGFNPQQISQMSNPEQVIDFLSRGLDAMDLDQRRQIAGSLGINDKAFRLLSDRAGMQSSFRRADELGAVPSDELLRNAEAFVTATGELGEMIDGFKQSLANEMLPGMTKLVEGITGFSIENREEIGKFFEEATPYLQATAAGIAVLVAAQVGKKGLDAMGGAKGAAGLAAKAGGIGALISAWDWGPDDVEGLIGIRPPDWLFKPLFGGSSSASGPLSNDAIFNALIQQESGGRHYGDGSMLLSSPKGARGITQVMPATGRDPGYGVRPLANDSRDEYLRFGRDYLAAMMKEFDGDTQKALAAYNAGPGAVKSAVASHGANWLSAMPGETQRYVPEILARVQQEPHPKRDLPKRAFDEDRLEPRRAFERPYGIGAPAPSLEASGQMHSPVTHQVVPTSEPPSVANMSNITQPAVSGPVNYYSIDARGATDPGAVEAAARKVFRAELSNAVQVSRDGIPNNVE